MSTQAPDDLTPPRPRRAFHLRALTGRGPAGPRGVFARPWAPTYGPAPAPPMRRLSAAEVEAEDAEEARRLTLNRLELTGAILDARLASWDGGELVDLFLTEEERDELPLDEMVGGRNSR